jgi:hypothetical protein
MKRKYNNPMRERLRMISSAKFGRKIFVNKVLKGDSKVMDMLDEIGRKLGLSPVKQCCTTGHDGPE